MSEPNIGGHHILKAIRYRSLDRKLPGCVDCLQMVVQFRTVQAWQALGAAGSGGWREYLANLNRR